MTKTKTEASTAEEAQRMANAEEMVVIKLPKSKEKSEPLLVQHGRYNALIPRGVEVRVPLYIKMHLDECNEMEDYAMKRLSKAQEAMSDMSAALGVPAAAAGNQA